MLGFVLGTGEGREILKEVNKFTSDIVVSTATKYGGELLSDYKIKVLNTEPLDLNGFIDLIVKNNINLFIDGTHPYAKDVSKTIMEACEKTNIEYIRYERKSYFDSLDEEEVISIDSYEELPKALEGINGTILNTTGSNNANLINSLNLKNRVIHRVLPMWNVIKKMTEGGISIENIIAVKGPFSIELNRGIIREYNIKAIITKDSGIEGSVLEKVEAILEANGKIILINKPKIDYKNKVETIEELIKYIKENSSVL